MSRDDGTAGFVITVVIAIGVLGFGGYMIFKEATEPLDGTVTSYEYQEEYTYYTESCTNVSNRATCARIPNHVNECYYVTYVHTDENGKETTGDDCTTKEKFETLHLGDHYVQDDK